MDVEAVFAVAHHLQLKAVAHEGLQTAKSYRWTELWKRVAMLGLLTEMIEPNGLPFCEGVITSREVSNIPCDF